MVNRELKYHRVKELLNYHPDTGVFRWIINKDSRGSVAGYIANNGYRIIEIDGTKYNANKLAFLWMVGNYLEVPIIHKNGIKDDNRWCNLTTYSLEKILKE